MKEMFANADIGLFGLLLFFAIFIGVLVWVTQPSFKEKSKQYSHIPLRDDRNDQQ